MGEESAIDPEIHVGTEFPPASCEVEREPFLGRPAKIVHVLHSFEIGGLENGVVNLINTLDWRRYQHALLCVTRAGPLVARLRRPDVEVVELGKSEGQDWYLSGKMARQMRRLKPLIVHTRNWGTIEGIIAGRLAGVPVVVHGEHGRTLVEIGKGNWKRKWVRKLLVPLMDAYVTVSEELHTIAKDEIGVPERKITTICNGVDLAKFSFEVDRGSVLRESGIPSDAFIIGCVGRLDPIKDYEGLIRILPGISEDFPELRLLIVGDGPQYPVLDALKRDLGIGDKVLLAGARDDIPRLLKVMDVFVLPSLSEGISNTILEAMASSLPVVATRVGGNTELVRHEETGFLVSSGNPSELSDALRAYLKTRSLGREHGSAGRRRVESHFSLSRMVASYDTLYQSLLRRKNILPTGFCQDLCADQR